MSKTKTFLRLSGYILSMFLKNFGLSQPERSYEKVLVLKKSVNMSFGFLK